LRATRGNARAGRIPHATVLVAALGRPAGTGADIASECSRKSDDGVKCPLARRVLSGAED